MPIDLTGDDCKPMLTPQEATAMIDKGIADLEEFAGAVVPFAKNGMTPDIADLEADVMLLSNTEILSGGSSRKLPKGKRLAAVATKPAKRPSAAAKRPAAAGLPAPVPKCSPYRLETSRAYHRAVNIARKENLSEEECKKRFCATFEKVRQ